jgi:LemA protein
MGTFITVIALIVLIVFIVVIYNSLVRLRQACTQALGDIDAQLKQRHDLIPNLVESVRGYTQHERETLQAVTDARSRAIASADSSERGITEARLSAAVGQLLAIAERYPKLRASANFMALQSQLAEVENKIAAARRFYNLACAEYNAAVSQFPTLLLSGVFGFAPLPFYEAEPAERRVPAIRF